jgi:hypothetical protein
MSAGVLAAAAVAKAGAAYAAEGSRPAVPGFVDAVLAALEQHRLVGVGEGGEHGLQEHHDALASLLSDPRLPDAVDDVVVEFGNALHQPVMDRFTAGGLVEDADLRTVWRDTTQSPMETWDEPVFERFYRTVRAVNETRPARRRIRVLLGDPPIDWSTVTTPDALMAFQTQRDSHAASVIAHEVLGKGRRALIVYGGAHLFHRVPQGSALPAGLVALVEQQTGEKVYVLTTLVPLAGDPAGLGARLSRYPVRTVIPTAGTWLGHLDAGAVFPSAIRGTSGTPTNIMCGVPVGSLIDAGVYVGQSDRLTVARQNPTVYLDPIYWAEIQRRNTLLGGFVNLDTLRQQQSVRFTPQAIPAQLECP